MAINDTFGRFNTLYRQIGNGANSLRNARLNPLRQQIASGRGALTQNLGRRGILGSSFGNAALSDFEINSGRALGDANALATNDIINQRRGVLDSILGSQTNLGVANIGANAQRDVANTNLRGTQYSADSRLQGDQLRADASRYGSDQQLAGTRLTADATRYGADQRLAGTRLASDATRYSADQGLAGTQLQADASRYSSDVSRQNNLNANSTSRYVSDNAFNLGQDQLGVQATANQNQNAFWQGQLENQDRTNTINENNNIGRQQVDIANILTKAATGDGGQLDLAKLNSYMDAFGRFLI